VESIPTFDELITFELALSRPKASHSNPVTPEQAIGARGRCLWYSRGRDALIAAVTHIRKPAARVLVPAFICPEVIEVLESQGHPVVLYPVDRRLGVDPQALRQALRPGDVFVYVRYYGLCRPTDAIRTAKAEGAVLLEDTCQAPFTHPEDPLHWPDLAFTSLRKYVPLSDGAALDVLNPAFADGVPLARCGPHSGFLFWRGAALRMRALYESRPRRIHAALAQECMAQATRRLRRGPLGAAMSRASRNALTRFEMATIQQARRANYTALTRSLTGMRNVQALLPDLPEDAFPYGCPILVPNSYLWQDALRQRQVHAAILWDRSDHWREFPDSNWLARHLLLLPVPQTNTTANMERIGSVLGEYSGD
jgi:dTDP-4-amino-4,6-dideoxygalactose transaminase